MAAEECVLQTNSKVGFSRIAGGAYLTECASRECASVFDKAFTTFAEIGSMQQTQKWASVGFLWAHLGNVQVLLKRVKYEWLCMVQVTFSPTKELM